MSSSEVLIIGAGVAGMVLAQGLKHRGIPFRLFERDESLSSKSQGYRFRLVHEGLEALERTLAPDVWELLERTHPMDSPADLLKVDAHTGETVMALRAKGDTDRERRCYPIDRPWFRELLSLGLEKHIEFGKAFEKYAFIDDGHVAVTSADGSSATGRLLVAADGVHSRVAKMRFPELKHLDVERTTLWGRTPLTPEFERRFDHPDVLQNHFSFMFDPDEPGSDVLVCADKVAWRYIVPFRRQAVKNSNLRSLFEMQDVDTLYAVNIVSSKPDLPLWEADPRLTFVGDAIHAMSPSGGSGGLTTVQDVADLCDALADAKFGEGELDRVKLKDCLQLYEDKMRARAKTAIEWSFQGGKMVWAGQEWHEYSHVRSS
ncbi:Demethylsterigmatocystin 6-O-methyltransferase 5 [Seiridium cupressi]